MLWRSPHRLRIREIVIPVIMVILASSFGLDVFSGPIGKSPPTVHAENIQVEQPIVNYLYDQLYPASAYNSAEGNYYIVWEDHFFGSGTDWDIMGAVVNAAGSVVAQLDVTSESSMQQLAPDVAYNTHANEYMVVWEDTYSTTDHDIKARRVSSSGTMLSGWLNIASLSNWERRPVIAYNTYRDEYLVVWEKRIGDAEFGQYDLMAQRIQADGSLLGSVITLDAGSTNQINPAVAYDAISDQYLVVWQDKDAGNWDIMGRMVSGTGSLGSELTIEAPGHDQVEPDVAFNPDDHQFLVVWQDNFGTTSEWDIKGWRLNASGGQIAWYMISSEGTQRRMLPAVVYKHSAEEYLIAFQYEYSTTDMDIRATRMAANGAMRQVDFGVSTASYNQTRPAVAENGGANYLAVWEDARNAASTGIDLYDDVLPVYEFSGYVYQGFPPNASQPIPYVPLNLYCASSPYVLGNLVGSTSTGTDGHYRFIVPNPNCEYFNIVASDLPGYTSMGASSVGGTVIHANQIQYTYPLSGKQTSYNNFWDLPYTPTSTSTSTCTSTPTKTATPTSTSTSTSTKTPTITQTLTSTSTSTKTPTITQTFTSTSTSTNTPTTTRTFTSTSTNTPTTTRTFTLTSTNTPTITQTPTPTTTRTFTSTSTNTPTITQTPTPTATLETSPESGAVSGVVHLERRSSSAGAVVEAGGQQAVTGPDGQYQLSGLPVGSATLSVRRQSYLAAWQIITVLTGQTLVLPDVTLLAGDINQDEIIELADLNLIGQAWNAVPGSPNWNPAADITDNGVVNILDMVAVPYNWDKTAPGPWGAFGGLTAPGVIAEPPLTADRQTARVSVSPAFLSVPGPGAELVFDILIEDVSSLYAYRLQIAFDPDVLHVVDVNPSPSASGIHITPGDFFDPQLRFVAVNQVDNYAGAVDFAVTQLFPAAARSGSGLLARITFRAVRGGGSPVELIQARLLDASPANPQALPVVKQDGQALVGNENKLYLPWVWNRQ